MYKLDSKNNIKINRGDIAVLKISANNQDGSSYQFQTNDVVKFRIYEENKISNVKLEKTVTVQSPANYVIIELSHSDTSLGEIANQPVKYWYDIQLNPGGEQHTIIGFEDDGAKIFKIYPAGVTITEGE